MVAFERQEQLGGLRRAWRYSRSEAALMAGVTVAVPLLGVEMALGLGVLLGIRLTRKPTTEQRAVRDVVRMLKEERVRV